MIEDLAAAAPAAVLWDMDGTLVDTEPYWIEAEYALVGEFGGSWTEEHALNLVGNDLLVSGAYIREHGGVDLAPAEIANRLIDGVITRLRDRVPWRPGAVELLGALAEQGIGCALVTSSWERLAREVADAVPMGPFAALVTGDRVRRGKPDPEPYATAAAALGVLPASCLAIEDSNTGATSAVAAGCPTLVVPNHVPIDQGPGRVFASTLAGFGWDEASAAFRAGTASLAARRARVTR